MFQVSDGQQGEQGDDRAGDGALIHLYFLCKFCDTMSQESIVSTYLLVTFNEYK